MARPNASATNKCLAPAGTFWRHLPIPRKKTSRKNICKLLTKTKTKTKTPQTSMPPKAATVGS